MNISKTLYDEFKKQYDTGSEYAGQRLGQAFCNHFNLHKHDAKAVDFDLLYNAGNVTAAKLIAPMIDWDN